MAVIRTRQYFLDLFDTGVILRATDLDDLVASIAFSVDLDQVEAGAPTGPAGGDLAGTYPEPTLANILPASVTVEYPRLTIDRKGRITAAESLTPQNDPSSASGVSTEAPLTLGNVQAELEALKTALAALSVGGGSGSSATGRTTLSRPGITVDVEYEGATAPTLGGSNGSYTLTIPTGTSWRVADVNAISGDAATDDDGGFSLTVSNENTGNLSDRAIAQIKDHGTGEILEWPQQERSIARTESVSGTGQVTNNWTEIGSLSGFSILLTR